MTFSWPCDTLLYMLIKKELKNATFEYNEDLKSFLIIDTEDGGAVELNKVYAFAFMRFVVRMAQRNWFRNKKSLNKSGPSVVESEGSPHPDQMNLFK
mgnify:CR=1 FL=1